MSRLWLPNLAELIDRLSIHQLKEVLIPEHKEKYAKEMEMIVHDINELLVNCPAITGDIIHAMIALAQINTHIWYNESSARKGENQDLGKLAMTHGLNGIRNRLMNLILYNLQQVDRLDYKTDCLAAEFKDWEMDLLREKK